MRRDTATRRVSRGSQLPLELLVWIASVSGMFAPGCNCIHPRDWDGGTGGGGMDSGLVFCDSMTPCPSGEYCLAGLCISDCSDTNPCPNGAMCSADGHCVGGACTFSPPITGCGDPCSASMPCPAGLYCGPDGTCTADCSASVACPNGAMCTADGHCEGGGLDAGVCTVSGCGDTCSASSPCPTGLYCAANGHCTQDCSGSSPCRNGGICTSDGRCIGASGDAGAGHNCPRTTEVDCGSGCINVLSDPNNCGSCGNACLPSQVCSVGRCMAGCTARQTDCNRSCVDLSTDSMNCGMCGHACPNNLVCAAGSCGCTTISGSSHGLTECSMECVNLDSDRRNCGSCSHECLTTCPSRAWTCDSQGIHCGPAGTGCGGTVDCGGCPTMGDTCGGGGVPGTCGHGGTCRRLTCSDLGVTCGSYGDGCGGTIDCGGCTLPDTCGGGGINGQCGRPVCSHMTCMDMCPSGTTFCDGVCFDLSNDASNCGGCGISCGYGGTCSGGSCHCGGATPDANGADAGHDVCSPGGCTYCPGPGCVNTASDLSNCGACGMACPRGQFCAMGACIGG